MAGECPGWVVPPLRRVVEVNGMCIELAEKVNTWHDQGQLGAMQWVLGFVPSPMTTRNKDGATWRRAVAECWAALCVAAGRYPTEEQFALLGEPAPETLVDEQDFAHGVWVTLAWLLGERVDPPVRLPERDEHGQVLPGAELYVWRPDPPTAGWLRAQERRQQLNVDEARRAWRWVGERWGMLTPADSRAPAPGIRR